MSEHAIVEDSASSESPDKLSKAGHTEVMPLDSTKLYIDRNRDGGSRGSGSGRGGGRCGGVGGGGGRGGVREPTLTSLYTALSSDGPRTHTPNITHRLEPRGRAGRKGRLDRGDGIHLEDSHSSACNWRTLTARHATGGLSQLGMQLEDSHSSASSEEPVSKAA